jgi:hypothetical protein
VLWAKNKRGNEGRGRMWYGSKADTIRCKHISRKVTVTSKAMNALGCQPCIEQPIDMRSFPMRNGANPMSPSNTASRQISSPYSPEEQPSTATFQFRDIHKQHHTTHLDVFRSDNHRLNRDPPRLVPYNQSPSCLLH